MSDNSMSPRQAQLDTDLSALTSGSLDAKAARMIVRDALKFDIDLVMPIYDALRDFTWRIVRSRAVPDDIAQWNALNAHCAAIAMQKDRTEFAAKFNALSEMLVQQVRFNERQPVDDLLKRLHVTNLLITVQRHNGEARRSVLADATGLEDANLSRVLGILDAHGLIARHRAGKESVISLTKAGTSALLQFQYDDCDRSHVWLKWGEAAPFPNIVWADDGDCYYCNDAFRTLMSRYDYNENEICRRDKYLNWLEPRAKGSIAKDAPFDTIVDLGKGKRLRCYSWTTDLNHKALIFVDIPGNSPQETPIPESKQRKLWPRPLKSAAREGLKAEARALRHKSETAKAAQHNKSTFKRAAAIADTRVEKVTTHAAPAKSNVQRGKGKVMHSPTYNRQK